LYVKSGPFVWRHEGPGARRPMGDRCSSRMTSPAPLCCRLCAISTPLHLCSSALQLLYTNSPSLWPSRPLGANESTGLFLPRLSASSGIDHGHLLFSGLAAARHSGRNYYVAKARTEGKCFRANYLPVKVHRQSLCTGTMSLNSWVFKTHSRGGPQLLLPRLAVEGTLAGQRWILIQQHFQIGNVHLLPSFFGSRSH